MENGLKKKYGLWTAVSMVIGIVIGSGVFFKAQVVLDKTNGNMIYGILAWIIGGAIMIVSSYVFATLATKYEKVNGVVDYAEATIGKKYGYLVGWFLATVYYPTLTCVLSWLSAMYTCTLFQLADPYTSSITFALAAVYMVGAYTLNALSPKLAGKFQVSTTVIKLIPLVLIAVVGTIAGLITGVTLENFTKVTIDTVGENPLLAGVVATAFAYEGWIIATSINSELKDSKKNLPKALILGAIVVVVVYLCYFIGIAGTVPSDVLMDKAQGATAGFIALFGPVGGVALIAVVVVSCLGTLNGLTVGCTRGLYALAVRDQGPNPKMLSQVDKTTNMPSNSAAAGILLTAIWSFVWYVNVNELWPINLDVSELPIVTIYAMYIPMYISIMIKNKEWGIVKRFIMPSLALCGAVFMIFAAIVTYGMNVVWYLCIFAVIMAIGCIWLFKTKHNNNSNTPNAEISETDTPVDAI